MTAEFLLFIKPQFMANAHSILHMSQCTHGHIPSRSVAPFQRFRCGYEWFDGHQKCVCKAFL